jgi:hypothetical protein
MNSFQKWNNYIISEEISLKNNYGLYKLGVYEGSETVLFIFIEKHSYYNISVDTKLLKTFIIITSKNNSDCFILSYYYKQKYVMYYCPMRNIDRIYISKTFFYNDILDIINKKKYDQLFHFMKNILNSPSEDVYDFSIEDGLKKL